MRGRVWRDDSSRIGHRLSIVLMFVRNNIIPIFSLVVQSFYSVVRVLKGYLIQIAHIELRNKTKHFIHRAKI